MSFDRPSIETLIDRIETDLTSRIGTGKPLRRSVVRALARAIAGTAHGLYAYINWLSKQAVPVNATDEFLEAWCATWSISRLAATFAAGDTVTFTGTNTTIIPAGTLIQRTDGVQFTTDALGTISAGTAVIAVTAVVAGDDSNTDAAVLLTLVSPIAGINSSATVGGTGISGGSDIETDDSLKDRLLARIATPPMGGSESDYEQWAQDASSAVTRVWVAGQEAGPGTVTVRFAVDAEDPPIPDAGTVTIVQDYIDARAPITAVVYVVAPDATDLDLTISITPDTADIRLAVQAEISDMLLRLGEPGGTIYLSQINEAISIASGETSHTLTLPAADVVYGANELPVLGTITWT